MKYIVFRYDDYSTRSPLALEQRILDLFKMRDLRFTIGVIPYVHSGDYRDTQSLPVLPLSDEKIQQLKKAEATVEVALHGYNHQSHRVEKASEFSGLPQPQQYQRMQKGKIFLEEQLSCNIATFIPPWNSYDKNTLRAMNDLGIKNLSANIHGNTLAELDIQYIPTLCGLESLTRALSKAKENSLSVFIFHDYSFKEQHQERGVITLDEFAKTLDVIKSRDDMAVLTLGEISQRKLFDAKFFRWNRLLQKVSKRLYLAPMCRYLGR